MRPTLLKFSAFFLKAFWALKIFLKGAFGHNSAALPLYLLGNPLPGPPQVLRLEVSEIDDAGVFAGGESCPLPLPVKREQLSNLLAEFPSWLLPPGGEEHEVFHVLLAAEIGF